MSKLFANWKTTSAGLAAILVALADIIHPVGGVPNLNGDIPAILAGIVGLFAKDFNH